MSRVERTENTSERRGSAQLRQAERGRGSSGSRRDTPAPTHTPSKAEGEESDVEQALNHQNE